MVTKEEIIAFWRKAKQQLKTLLSEELKKGSDEIADILITELDDEFDDLILDLDMAFGKEMYASWSIDDVIEDKALTLTDKELTHIEHIQPKLTHVIEKSVKEALKRIRS